MKHRLFRRSHAAGARSPEYQAVVDAIRVLLTPEPWTPGSGQAVAIRVGPFIERGRSRHGDNHVPDAMALALQHPDVPYTRYADRYTRKGL
ncbi:hypothetical protein ACFY41_29560 [Streptomyces syringium]|uniref:hypothetical protein n=1 Tax=Streptomyces syringium TaxID=76729 RepID=UPI0036C3B26D